MISLSDLLFLPLCTDVLGIVESYCEFHPNVWLSEVAYWLSSNFNVPLTSFRVLKERRLFFCMPFSVYTQWDRFVRKTMFFLFGNHTPCAHLRATDEVVFAVKRSIVCHIEQKMIKLKRQGTNWFRQHLTPQEQKDRPVNWVNYTLFDVDERAIDRMLAFFGEQRCFRKEYKLNRLRRRGTILERRVVSGYTFIPPGTKFSSCASKSQN